MTGRTGYSLVTNGMSPDGPTQMKDIYEHFDPLIGETVTTASALPASGNWTGRAIYVQDTGSMYVWSGSAWVDRRAGLPTAVAAGTVASPGGGSSSAPVYYDNSVAVTLPVGRFTQTPIVTATSDVRATGGVSLGCGISSVSAASFVLRQTRLGAAPAGFYANWIAVQMTPTSGAG